MGVVRHRWLGVLWFLARPMNKMVTLEALWQLVKSFWPILALVGLLLLIRLLFEVVIPNLVYRWRNKKSFAAGLKWRSDRGLLYKLRSMTPDQFEDYIANLFSKLGYKTEATGGSHDQGIDVIAKRDGIIYYIQCKKFITSEVTVGAIRDFYGAIADHIANGKGYFITTNKFTLEAEKFAEDKPIELIDSYKLIEYIKLAENTKQ